MRDSSGSTRAAWLAALVVCALAVPVSAELVLPPGFTSRVYVSGQGFDRGAETGARGIPIATTLTFDRSGVLYVAKSGNRYGLGESDSLLSHLYRIPVGGAWITPASEARYFYGPPLMNVEVGAVGARGDVFVTTYDPDRKIGVIYRVTDGRPVLFTGGTPPAGSPPLLAQPEGMAFDALGHVYVADRARDRVVKLDGAGRVLDPHYLGVPRARMLAIDPPDHLWVGGDGTADRPWQEGSGQIWRVDPDGRARLLFEGPHAAGIDVGPGGALFVAQRQGGTIFVVTPEGRRLEFAGSAGDTVPRSLAFAPVTAETQRAGIAGDLFVVTLSPRTWYVNEVIRISGPFDDFVRRHGRPAAP